MFDWVLHTPLRHLTVMACLWYVSLLCLQNTFWNITKITCKIFDLHYFAVQVLDRNKWVKKTTNYMINTQYSYIAKDWFKNGVSFFSIVVSVFYLHCILFQSASLPWFTLILLTADNNLRKSKILLIRIKNKRKKTRCHRVGGITRINSFLGGSPEQLYGWDYRYFSPNPSRHDSRQSEKNNLNVSGFDLTFWNAVVKTFATALFSSNFKLGI